MAGGEKRIFELNNKVAGLADSDFFAIDDTEFSYNVTAQQLSDYIKTKLNILNLATKALDNLSPAGQAKFDAKANKDLSNVDKLSQSVVNSIMPNAMDYVVSSSIATNGYIKFKSGFIIQWGTGGGPGTVTFPTPFANVAFSVQITPFNVATNNNAPSLTSITNTNFTWVNPNVSPAMRWLAVGL